jgi:hypothetical protein
MRKLLLMLLVILNFYLISCSNSQKHNTKSGGNSYNSKNQNESEKKYIQVNIKVDLKTPTVGIKSFTLITNDLQRDISNAQVIIQAKVMLPLAMQKHDETLFDSVLSKDFIYHGEEAFFNRKEYIHDRVNAKWMISDVQYENMVLEFFDDFGVLTYRNKVKERDESGKDQLYFWFWTDIWIKENGRWKIKDLRAIN